MKKRILKFLLFGFAFIFLGFFIYYLYMQGLLSVDKVKDLVDSSGSLGPLVFAFLYILITTFGISAAAFTVLAGSLFGTLNGLIIVVISATISASIAFFVARFFREKVLAKEKEKKGNKGKLQLLIQRIEENAEEKGLITIVLLRLAFLPYIPLSYAAGLVRKLKAFDFIAATFITNIFGSFVFIFLGDKLEDILMGNIDLQTIVSLIIAVVLLVVFVRYVPKLANYFEKKKLEKNGKKRNEV